MPAELDKMPEKLSVPEPPENVRWLVIVMLITSAGVMLSLYLWPDGMTTHTLWFWFCTFGIPAAAALGCYAFRLRAYENERERVRCWNDLHQTHYDRLVKRGRRTAGLIGKAYITPIACNKLASALLDNGSQLQTQYFACLQRTLTTARLDPAINDFSTEGYQARLSGYIRRLRAMLEPDLLALPDNTLSVRIQHDGSLDNAILTQIWQDIFAGTYTMNQFIAGTESDGVMWLDPWLDQREAKVMLSVEINLFSTPRDFQAESVSALLLASPEWLARYQIKPEAVIHRPVVATAAVDTTKEMLRWGALSAEASYERWRSQVNKEALAWLRQHAESTGYGSGLDEEYSLDDLFGNPGAAIGNMVLICACEHAIASAKPQWVMAESQTTHQLLVRKEDC